MPLHRLKEWTCVWFKGIVVILSEEVFYLPFCNPVHLSGCLMAS